MRVTTDSDKNLSARDYFDVENLSVEMLGGDANPPPNVSKRNKIAIWTLNMMGFIL